MAAQPCGTRGFFFFVSSFVPSLSWQVIANYSIGCSQERQPKAAARSRTELILRELAEGAASDA
jgi:hypothetical protein